MNEENIICCKNNCVEKGLYNYYLDDDMTVLHPHNEHIIGFEVETQHGTNFILTLIYKKDFKKKIIYLDQLKGLYAAPKCITTRFCYFITPRRYDIKYYLRDTHLCVFNSLPIVKVLYELRKKS